MAPCRMINVRHPACQYLRGIRAHAQSSGPRRNFASISHDPRVPDYSRLTATLDEVRKTRLPAGRPLTLTEKILYSHLEPNDDTAIVRGDSYLKLNVDRVAMQDASAQMALLQFMLARRATTAVPSSIHCDHLIEAHLGADEDVKSATVTNKEIFDFLRTAAEKYGISFWGPGSGIIHQIVLENYAAPGSLMLGTDSHTPNAGGLGMLAIGVGGADAVDAMAGIPWELKAPKVMGVRLVGKLDGWTSPKDVILKIAGQLTVRGGTNHIIEYSGPGAETLSCTAMATICNMGAEVGATTSTFPYSSAMSAYLRTTGRSSIADAADAAARRGFLRADHGAEYDEVIELDLSTLEPHISGPWSPDAATPLSKFRDLAIQQGWPDKIEVGLIGSCTNSSYEDMSRAAAVAKEAFANGLTETKSSFLITPGSEQIRATIERDGQTEALSAVGGEVLANACGPCIGQWKRPASKEPNAILTSFNRNFRSRNDGNANTMNFLASPEIVTAMAFAGRLTFNPVTDHLITPEGSRFRFSPPNKDVHALPKLGFIPGRRNLAPPEQEEPNSSTEIVVSPSSTRLQLLDPFPAWTGQDFQDLKILAKVEGKCTTDHISAAGPWLAYKGHLDNISSNTLIGAKNSFTGAVNLALDDGRSEQSDQGTIPEVARRYKARSTKWCIIADANYGEGSAREHAALQPRHLGCVLVVARSFARIHETNLKKQGIVPLTFRDPDDWNRIVHPGGGQALSLSTRGLADSLNDPTSSSDVELLVTMGSRTVVIPVTHSLSSDQCGWIRAGSALNAIAQARAASELPVR